MNLRQAKSRLEEETKDRRLPSFTSGSESEDPIDEPTISVDEVVNFRLVPEMSEMEFYELSLKERVPHKPNPSYIGARPDHDQWFGRE